MTGTQHHHLPVADAAGSAAPRPTASSWALPSRQRPYRIGRSVVAQRLDQLVLGHVGASVDVQVGGPLTEMLDGPVVVRSGRTAPLTDLVPRAVGRGVGDTGRLLLRIALVAELLVKLWSFTLGPGSFEASASPLSAFPLLPGNPQSGQPRGSAAQASGSARRGVASRSLGPRARSKIMCSGRCLNGSAAPLMGRRSPGTPEPTRGESPPSRSRSPR